MINLSGNMKFSAFLMPVFFATMLYQPLFSQKVEVVKFERLHSLMNEESGKIKVINFWATWCKPCIRELPQFEEINQEFGQVKVFLISFDDVETLHTKVEPFLEKRNIKSEVKLLDETDYNAFIDKVHESWSGAIPATLIIDEKGDKHFFEKEFEEGELKTVVLKFLN